MNLKNVLTKNCFERESGGGWNERDRDIRTVQGRRKNFLSELNPVYASR